MSPYYWKSDTKEPRQTMMFSQFEIKVALLGFVSVGKTTVLNALLRDKYGEVSMRRTTAGVNYFRISYRKSKRKPDDNDSVVESEAESDSMDWSVSANNRWDAKTTLKEITEDNAAFRESDEIHEKFFDIEHDEEICEMRKDTKLVVVDIPGVNEAGVGGKYKEYVSEKWDTFDCVVVVMDGRQGVNTEESIELLEFVKKNNEEKKDIPAIILCNKVDDPDDEEQQVLVNEARKEVERVFAVPNRQAALSRLVSSPPSKKKKRSSDTLDIYPAFIATSAIHAFIYQTASLMTLEQFKKFDKDLIDKLGREEVGKWKWKKLSREEKYRRAHEAVSDSTRYRERLEATNFDKFLTALSCTVGGSGVQLGLIQKQLDVAVASLSPEKCIAGQISSIYHKKKVLGQPTFTLKDKFWKAYSELENIVFDNLKEPANVTCLTRPFDYLKAYLEFAHEVGWPHEEDVIAKRMKGLVRHQVVKYMNEERLNRNINWRIGNHPNPITWDKLSPEDWKMIARSILLLSYNETFCHLFGQEKLLLESTIDKINRASNKCLRCGLSDYHQCDYNSYCRCSNTNDALQVQFQVDNDGVNGPMNEALHIQVYQLKIPESIEDPSHWGYLAWKVCDTLKSFKGNGS